MITGFGGGRIKSRNGAGDWARKAGNSNDATNTAMEDTANRESRAQLMRGVGGIFQNLFLIKDDYITIRAKNGLLMIGKRFSSR
jgi:hypothetical protein